jgi:hypothetical protein
MTMAHLYRVEFTIDIDQYETAEVLDGLNVFSPMADVTIHAVSPADIPNSQTGKYIFGPDKSNAPEAEGETVEAE